jgi:hypothetical protein
MDTTQFAKRVFCDGYRWSIAPLHPVFQDASWTMMGFADKGLI